VYLLRRGETLDKLADSVQCFASGVIMPTCPTREMQRLAKEVQETDLTREVQNLTKEVQGTT
jgi:hypothetical protein